MTLHVTADDCDSDNPRKGTTTIKIIVKDDNNHDPNIILHDLTEAYINKTCLFDYLF